MRLPIILRSLRQTFLSNKPKVRICASLLAVILLPVIQAAPTKAQEPKPTPDQTPTVAGAAAPADAAAPAATPTPPPPIRDVVKVTGVYNLAYSNPSQKDIAERKEAGLNDVIIIEVEQLEALLLKSKCEKPYDHDCKPQEIALFIEGRVIKGLKPESGAPSLDNSPPQGTPSNGVQKFLNGRLRFHLQRNTDDCTDDCREHWADLLGFSTSGSWKWKRPLEISVGLADDYPVKTEVKPGSDKSFSLVRVREYRLPFWILFTLGCIIVLIWLARRYDLLCDRAPVLWGQRRPYSLSAVQAAWWFIVILISFIFIWLITGQYDFSSTALILLGIGSGTALGATVIDANKRNETSQPQIDTNEINQLLADKQKLEIELNDLIASRATQAAIAQKKAEYENKISEIKQKFPNALGPGHETFFIDILSDSKGVNFHRFQMLVWTIVLGVFFIISVLGRLGMPDFSTTLLGLMGLSAGTYLGFKIPEKNNETTTPAAVPPAQGGANPPDQGGANPPDQGGANPPDQGVNG